MIQVKSKILRGFLAGIAVFLMIPAMGQTFNDGPMNVQVRVGYVYVNAYHDVFGGYQEPVWYVWAADDTNQDGQGWRNSAGCINRSCACYLWQGQPGGLTGPTEIIMSHNYGTNVPQRFDLDMETWEDDGIGGSCTYNGPCSICVDPDDAHCGRARLVNNVQYRTAGPPCQWIGADDTFGDNDYYLCGNSWGVGIMFYWRYNASTAGTHIWRGHNSTNWFEACNWSTSSVPTSARNVIIPGSGHTYAPTISGGTAYCNTIEIQGSTVLTIATGSSGLLQVTQ